MLRKKKIPKVIEKTNRFHSVKDRRKELRKVNLVSNQPKPNRFEMIGIKLASPEKIKEWCQRQLPNGEIVGEIREPDTINYRTGRAEPDGLLCEKIFGPLKSWECSCGKYKFRPRTKPFYCDICWVEVTESHVRRHRMGYIVLNCPVTHIWYLKGSPSYLSNILEIPVKELETIIYLVNDRKTFSENDDQVRSSTADLLETDSVTKHTKSTINQEGNSKDWLFEWLKKISELESKKDNFSFFPLEDDDHLDQSLKKTKRFRKQKRPKTYQDFVQEEINALLFADNGSRRILNMLESLDLNEEIEVAREEVSLATLSRKEKLLKRLRLLETFKATKTDPSWMILTVVPVLPPGLRPVFELPNGTFMSSEFNEHYRSILIRNNRLLKFCRDIATEEIVNSDKLYIQQAVDNLIDNGSRRDSYGARNKPLRCLNDLIAGKEGRFRQNLLGKRVDYSGRSVIVVGPNLMLDQCAIPYDMALNLFGPYLIYKIREIIPRAKELDTSDLTLAFQRNYPIIWTLLSFIASVSLILLNRAPTLHRLGIQAFRPILTTGRAIQLHPLVCPGFNADFDGDQMGVHLPLTRKTQLEAYRMLSSNNLLSPANGRPILTPGQDIVLGWYYLTTRTLPNIQGSNLYFTNFSEICEALEHNTITIHSTIWIKYVGKLIGIKKKLEKLKRKEILKDGSTLEIYDDIQLRKDKNKKIVLAYVRTTAGRVLVNELIAAAIFARPI